jgi:uncharacterized membrane protein
VKDFLPSSPFFFRIIKRAMVLLVGILFFLGMVIPAPLEEPANIADVPNPVKAAWFFLWIQELASYSKYLVYAVILAGVYFLLLPYHPGVPEAKKAEWLPRDQRVVNIVTIAGFLFITVLTVIAMFFRGKNWAFVYPF